MSNRLALQQIQALFEKGITAHKAGDFIGAKTFYTEALAQAPNDINILQNIGALHLAHARYAEAASYLGRALEIGRVPVGVLRSLAAALSRMGKYTESVNAFEAYRQHNPDDQEIALDYLQALFGLNKFKEMLKYCASIPDSNPRARIVAVYGAEAEMALGAIDPAIARLQKALTLWPDHIELLPALGKAYSQARLFDQAVTCQRRAVEIQPDEGMHWNNLGNALKNADMNEEAIAAFQKARMLKPSLAAPALTNEAYVYKRLGDLNQAIALAAEALIIDPLNVQAHYAYGTLNLMAQNYLEAWPHIEWRWHKQDSALASPPFPLKLWHGGGIRGKTLAIYADQGIGDIVQMLRYLPLIGPQFGPSKIRVYAPKKLEGVVTRNNADIEFIASDAPGFVWKETEFDVLAAFCSLPYIFRTAIDAVPAQSVLLAQNPKNYKSPAKSLVVGLSWYTKSLDAGYKRSMSLESFAGLKDIPGIRFIDLQYGDTAVERKNASASGFDLFHDESVDQWSDMQSFIDQIHGCDLVISIDNTTVHAAGACGVPVWTLLPFDPYWRWHTDQEGNPWYPSMRIFRQTQTGNFESVLAQVRADLKALAGGDSSVLTPKKFIPRKAAASKNKRALLINDTSAWYHWGCTATSEALQKNIAAKGYDVVSVHHREIADSRIAPPLLAKFDDADFLAAWRYYNPSLFDAIAQCDAAIFNGEGTIHGLKDNALRLLYLGYAAKTVFDKNLQFINHACFPFEGSEAQKKEAAAIYKKVYSLADAIVVRDEESHKDLTSLGIDSVAAFDSLPLRARDWLAEKTTARETGGKTILLAGSSAFSPVSIQALHRYIKIMSDKGYRFICLVGARHHPARDDHDFLEAMRRAPAPVTIYNATSLDDWFSHIENADLLISGRFHYSIAAACLGTPFVAFEGNTPKLHALCALLGEKAPLNYTKDNLYELLKQRAAESMDKEEMLRAGRAAILERLCSLAAKNYEKL